MKINFDLKCKFPSVEFCYNNKCVIIRYWGGLKFDKVVIYGGKSKMETLEEALLQIRKTPMTFEPKQETLEEAVERLFPFTKDDSENRIITIKRLFWIEGAKWQAERMYSEEDLLSAFEAGMMFIGEDKGSFKEWFEQFKKK